MFNFFEFGEDLPDASQYIVNLWPEGKKKLNFCSDFGEVPIDLLVCLSASEHLLVADVYLRSLRFLNFTLYPLLLIAIHALGCLYSSNYHN